MYKDIYDACNKINEGRSTLSIVDLGARYGEGYELFGVNYPEASYTFVEPSDRCTPNIKNLISKYPNAKLRLIDGVLGSKSGKLEFFQLENDNDQSGNLFSDRDGCYGPSTKKTVNVYDYKSIFSQIDFVKCNIEGAEYSLIEGGFFDIVNCFVMEVHNSHVPNKNYKNAIDLLSSRFDLTLWGNPHYKYCFINGIKK
ncbi:MAG: FkbM family methyltransferase [Caulobacteraceae bacterium]|nr:FkbM family methyltransferase [Caulobacteraceae bacterium]